MNEKIKLYVYIDSDCKNRDDSWECHIDYKKPLPFEQANFDVTGLGFDTKLAIQDFTDEYVKAFNTDLGKWKTITSDDLDLIIEYRRMSCEYNI